MDKAPAVLIENQRVPRPRPAPRLRLLIELEPRHRVFFRNLADLLLWRRVPQFPVTSRPGRFWNDVFVPSGAPWSSFLESMLLHSLLVVLFVWGQSRVWVSVKLFPQPEARHTAITYYPPAPSFRASESRSSSTRSRSRTKPASAQKLARERAMPVTPERKPSFVTPPDIKQAAARPPDLPASHAVTPMAPFPAATGQRSNVMAGSSGVVAPSPQVDQATARRLAVPQGSPVAPAPDLGGSSGGRAMKAPNTGGLGVVPPPPSVQTAANSARGRSLSGAGPNVVPPPPSVQGADARSGSISGTGSQVVPPPPSVQSAGNSRAGRLSSLSGTRPSVVPPPPSVQGTGNATGDARLGSMAGSGSQVVPPPPSVQESGGPGGTRSGSISGSEVVPPPPSVETAGSGAGGRLGSLPGDGSPTVSPPAPVESAGNSGAGGPGKILEPMDPLPTGDGSGTTAGNNEKATVEELPLGLLGVVFAAPGTSFFSNFEVFVAKRRVGKNNDQMQLIKLVYEFLPYQRRLSEYNLNNLPARVIKLRVTPDPSCDESLGQIVQPHSDPNGPATEYPKLPAALLSFDPSAVLPCYRTTAGDFQKAMSRTH